MSQFKYHPLTRAFLYLKRNTNTFSQPTPSPSPSPSPNCYIFLLQIHNHHQSSPIPIRFFSTTTNSDQNSSFTVSYLKDKCGFSLKDAIKTSKRIHFDSPHKPDSNLAFFRNYGFSQSQINSIIARVPSLITCDPNKSLLPKFQFLASKGASHDDILHMVNRSPCFVRNSLQNQIIPMYELVRRFCPSDEKAIAYIISCPTSLCDGRVNQNVKMLLEQGLTGSIIHHLLRTRPSILCSSELIKTVEELKQLGFQPSKFDFGVALLAKRAVTKSQWDAKVEVFKRWGWSDQEIVEMFRRTPQVMLRSDKKLKAVMSFWIDQLGWDRSALCSSPILFGYSLEKRLIPRASVIKYLLSKGLMKETASLATPFSFTDESFLRRYVTYFMDEERPQLLKLYQGGC